MVEEFLTRADDEQFKLWMTQHPNGFYLNEGRVGSIKWGEGGMILHEVGCFHLGNGAGIISTTYAKAASDDLQALIVWAEQNNLTVVVCSTCQPA